ncbi:MAG TPA: NADH-quinone oxidoreductase subunit A [Pirellulaceae bacterium]|jgi:NADH-quinone oxidoreductase subunit A|nr:NADH-quinone oxidoreductase subunit A [Pirellulaceae bacterium]
MTDALLPILLFAACATALSLGLLLLGWAVGPKRQGAVKQMPYESGMDPIHDAHRRFDVRFHLVAIAFLLFDVELLFLYPWAVASRDPAGLPSLFGTGGFSRGLVFAEVLVFIGLLFLGWVYAWRKGVFQWR